MSSATPDHSSSSIGDVSQQRVHTLQLPHGAITLPVYMPDATLGVVRAIDATDLEADSVQAVVMNTFHLMQRPGSSTIQALGGLHQMSAWQRPIVTDSGGFQAYSLIQQNAKFGSLSNDGITFKPEGSNRKFLLSPEKAIQLQFSYDSDVVMCLDYCTHVDAPEAIQEEAVERTIEWAKRCKREFQLQVAQRKLGDKRPHLFGVIQGGGSFALRKRCAEALLEIGFDGFGYGGWPLDKQGKLLIDIITYTRELVPASFPMHALGVGHPGNVAECAKVGYGIFDSAMPTRDARHGRLYAFADRTDDAKWFSYIYVNDDKHIKSERPVSIVCDCLCCSHYSLGYLHHLFKVGDTLFYRLATLHNLRFMTMLEQRLREVYAKGA
ncbi:tRNA guanosine(34) transglycosylase Tgt [Ktedonospora formicarum]|uniref:tRNA-guanine transglycosylase n=1 Tax=Ktedonospora formicarum TaxID=2778364 RepID=A0A8J3HZ33_9CHLR|nr:tRNA guanosine(34) transglycosylase Tgt [Ktedonospora formicarum]GHO43643.1 tRNA-guanine transglycosylase [Ktedonospora formicarum]